MNLTELSVEDLDKLIARLQYLSEAGEQLRELGAEPVFRILPGRPVIITAGEVLPVAFDFGPPPPFVVEPAEPKVHIQVEEIPLAAMQATGGEKPGGSGDLQQLGHVESPPADTAQREQAALEGAVCEPQAGAMPAAELPPEPTKPAAPAKAAPVKTGPLADDERAAIWALHAQGKEPREIADRIGRRLQLVASVIANSKKNPTGQPVAAASTSSPAVAVNAKPEAPAADAEVPSADTGKPAPVRAAGATAPKAGGAAPDTVQGLTLRQRQIAAELAALGYRDPWTAKLDLGVVEDLMRGAKAPEVALDMGIDLKAFSERARRLYDTIRDSRGQVTLDGQKDLLAVLRHRAGEA